MENNNFQTLQSLFTDNREYRIADYQRGYAWEDKHWNDLWEDLDLLEPEHAHYTGTLVIKPIAEVTDNDVAREEYEIFEVVDGQQRLTTLLILLDTIAEQYVQINRNDDACSIQDKYLRTVKDGQQYLRLQLNKDTNEYWHGLICKTASPTTTPENKSQERLSNCLKFFADKMAEALRADSDDERRQWLDALVSKVTTWLRLTVYQVDDDSDVGVIFEVMNNRGRPLTNLEKVKNYLLYLCDRFPDSDERSLTAQINKAWTAIYESLMDAGIPTREDDLLRYNWLVFRNHRPKDWRGSDSIREVFSQRRLKGDRSVLAEDIRQYVNSLENTIKPFCDILCPEHSDAFKEIEDDTLKKEIVEYSNKLKRLGTTATFIPLLIATRLSKQAESSQERSRQYFELLQNCEKFAFCIFKMAEKRSHTGQSRLYGVAFEYQAGTISFEQLIAILKDELSRRCPRSKFEEYVADRYSWYQWGGIRYLLYEYEMYVASGKPMHVSWKDFVSAETNETVEHILPQKPTRSYWRKHWRSKNERESALNDIGNLVWVTPSENSKLSNKGFDTKREIYGQSGLHAAQELYWGYKDWDVTAYQQRRKKLEAWMLKRWHYTDAVLPDSIGVAPYNDDEDETTDE
jgi:hypothetical protein